MEHERVRRMLADTVARIWRGFKFKLEAPSTDYKKLIGGEELGASYGIIIKNMLDIEIGELL